MVISSTKRPPGYKRQQKPVKQEPIAVQGLPDGKTAAEWADTVKQRSTLVNLVEPVGVVVGYLSHPLMNLKTLADGGSALIRGDFGGVGDSLGTLVDRGYNPDGVGGVIYNSAQVAQAVSGAAVGSLEVYAGLMNNDKYLAMMGGADLLGAAGNAALVANWDAASLGLSMTSNAAKMALVLGKPDKYSRTQKVKTILDSSGAVASSMLKAGFLTVPALGVSAVAGVGQIAYMNHEGFRNKVDKVLDKIFGPEKRGPEQPLSGLSSAPPTPDSAY
jgi:hypothetical protein